jgi:hypothetical protein
MKEELLQRLDALAAKLGVAVEHLWDVLVVQGYVEGATALALTLVGASLVVVGVRMLKKNLILLVGADQDEEPRYGVMAFVWGIGAVVGCIVFATNVIYVKYLFNPEFYALYEILKLVR